MRGKTDKKPAVECSGSRRRRSVRATAGGLLQSTLFGGASEGGDPRDDERAGPLIATRMDGPANGCGAIRNHRRGYRIDTACRSYRSDLSRDQRMDLSPDAGIGEESVDGPWDRAYGSFACASAGAAAVDPDS